MQKQIRDLKTSGENTGGTKRKAEDGDGGEGGDLPESSPAKKTTTLVTSDDGDDDVQCVMIAKNISKEAEIKDCLLYTSPSPRDGT